METVVITVITIVVSILGYLIHRSVSDIDESITEIKSSQYKMSERQRNMELEQKSQSEKLSYVSKELSHAVEISNKTKSTLDHNLYEMRQELKVVSEEQYEHKKNWGKVIIIIQKLHAAIKKDTKE